MIRMAIQVVLVDEAGDRRDVHEIVRIDRGRLCPEALGLSLEEAKAITGGIQQVLAGAQVAEWHSDQRACPDCGRRRSLKGRHHIVFRTPFGALRLDSERLRTCPCAKRPASSMSPLAELLRERVSPEMLYLETKFASLVSYGLTVGLLGELLPLERPIGAERVRRHLFRVAEAHETELASAPTSITLDEPPSAVSKTDSAKRRGSVRDMAGAPRHTWNCSVSLRMKKASWRALGWRRRGSGGGAVAAPAPKCRLASSTMRSWRRLPAAATTIDGLT